MAHRDAGKRNPTSRKAMARRRQRAARLTTAFGAFLTFGLGPLANVPQAKADEFDVIIDQILNAISGSLDNAIAAFDPSLAADLGALGLGATDATGGVDFGDFRSEERRVGKECRSRWSPYH